MTISDLLRDDPTRFMCRFLVDTIVTVVILIIGDNKGIFKELKDITGRKIVSPISLFFSFYIFIPCT